MQQEDTSVASNKRERELARMRAERQAARRAADVARRKQRRNALFAGIAALAVVGVVVAVALVVGLGGDEKKTTVTTASGTFGNLGGVGSCSYTKSGEAARKLAGLPPTAKIRTTGTQKVTFVTTQGTITASLLTSKAPCTINSLKFLADQAYFDNTPCPRVVTSGIFVLQCGDPTGTTSGGPGYGFGDENLQGATYPAGTLAMANSGQPMSNGSQFFMVYKDSQLPPNYTPFGKITSGLDVIEKVAAKGDDGSNSAGGGKPKLAISLTKVTVV